MRFYLLFICLFPVLAADAEPQSLKNFSLKGKVHTMRESTKDTIRLKKNEFSSYREKFAEFNMHGDLLLHTDTTVKLAKMKVISLDTYLYQYEYNDDNKPVKKVEVHRVFEAAGKPVSDTMVSYFTYNNGRLSEIRHIRSNSSKERDSAVIKLAFNSSGHMIKREWLKKWKTGQQEEVYKYDNYGDIVDGRFYDPYTGARNKYVDTTFTYDRKEQTKTAKFSVGEGFSGCEYTQKTDSKDRVLEVIQDCSVSITGPVRTTYTMFDNQGNYRKSITFRKKELPEVTLRQIEYYP
jgi:hypothetical protein